MRAVNKQRGKDNMRKAGLIMGGVMVILAAVLGFVFPLIVPCLALFVGAGAGYLGASYVRPATAGLASRAGAGAGAIAGVGAIVGHILSGVASAISGGPGATAALIERFGPSTDVSSPMAYYSAAIGFGCCFGLVELVLMTALGSLGDMLWSRMAGRADSTGAVA
jgi:hypothetical protein